MGPAGDLAKTLVTEHKGKTMTGGLATMIALIAWGMDAGVVPIPATRDFVEEAISHNTKGLDYLVRQAIEADVDIAAYEVKCMAERWKQGQLERLKEQYEDLVGSAYIEKDCEELERRMARYFANIPMP